MGGGLRKARRMGEEESFSCTYLFCVRVRVCVCGGAAAGGDSMEVRRQGRERGNEIVEKGIGDRGGRKKE